MPSKAEPIFALCASVSKLRVLSGSADKAVLSFGGCRLSEPRSLGRIHPFGVRARRHKEQVRFPMPVRETPIQGPLQILPFAFPNLHVFP